MDAGIAPNRPLDPPLHGTSLEARLERGQLLSFDACPFALPADADQELLQQLRLFGAKEIAFDPARERLWGHEPLPSADEQRLRRLFAEGLAACEAGLQQLLPGYAGALVPYRASFHPEEEATRKLRMAARNDLLHVDAGRTIAGARLLRLGINLSPVDPRVLVTSDTMAKVLPVHGPRSGLLAPAPVWSQRVLTLFRPHRLAHSPYDDFMLGFARYLKLCDEFQEKSPRKTWHFGPKAAWLAFTDGLVHAELRGRQVLDFAFLVPEEAWVAPEHAPGRLLAALGASFAASRAA